MANSRLTNTVLLNSLCLFFLVTVAMTAYGQEIRVDNTATFVGGGQYEWTVFLVADQSVLESIRYVEYTLHPSFPEPVQTVTDCNTRFALSVTGLDEFPVSVRIVFHDGQTLYLEHWLHLEERSIEDIETQVFPHSEHGEIFTANTAERVGEEHWMWTVFIVADDRTLDEIECVKYILHPSFPDPIHEICEKGEESGRGFFFTREAWEPFNIGVEVMFNDGDVRYLEHRLVFSVRKKLQAPEK